MRILIITSLILGLLPAVCFAVPEEIRQQHESVLTNAIEGYQGAKRDLESLPDETVFQERKVLIEHYLYHALYMIYRAKVNANITFDSDLTSTNSDLSSLATLGYLPEWPTNPLNADQPIRVVTSTGAFSPGDIVFLTAPSGFESSIGDQKFAASFMMFIYGIDENHHVHGKHVLSDKNKRWGSVPQGARYGWDFWVASDADKEESRRLVEEWRKKNPEEAARLDAERGRSRD